MLRGVVVDADGGQPLTAVLVTLVDAANRDVARYFVDSDGAFRFSVSGSGPWSIRAERMGAVTTTLDDLVLESGETTAVRVAMVLQAVALPGIDVRGEGRCELEAGAGDQVQQVWEAARKILSAASHTDSAGMYRYQLVSYTRELNPRTLAVQEEASSVRGTAVRRPIRSRPVSVLADSGFVVPHRSGDVYYAPDADALLSDWFLDTHCFLIRPRSDDNDGLIGLEFRPISMRTANPDIRGVLWLSPVTGQLHFLEFQYTSLPFPAREAASDHLGGRVEFRGFDDGTWIVSTWHIRMPIAAEVREQNLGTQRIRLVGIQEQGGRVASARRYRGGAVVFSAHTGSLTGRVSGDDDWEYEGASVRIIGVDRSAAVDSLGRFRLDDLAAGVYNLAYTHPDWKGLDRSFAVAEVEVSRGDTSTVVIEPPANEDVLAAFCRVNEWTPRTGVVLGAVVDPETGVAIPDVDVTVSWQSLRSLRLRSDDVRIEGSDDSQVAVTDESGAFSFCGIPTDLSVAISAKRGTSTIAGQSVVLPVEAPVAVVVIDWR